MTTLRLVLGDQLSRAISSLADVDPARDVVLMAEVAEETRYVPHHKQKIAFILSAMRHHAQALRADGLQVDYVRLDDDANSGSFGGEVARALRRHAVERIIVTEPGEWRLLETIRGWSAAFGLPVEIRPDTRFFCTTREFAAWAGQRRALRMEFFYREMRRTHRVLIDADGGPVGGAWNFDRENRKTPPRDLAPPPRRSFAPDAVTREVLDLVARRFPDNFGELEPFAFAVTHAEAAQVLDAFLAHALPRFGDYQDAMRSGAPFLWHGVISPYLNVGLLDPRRVVRAVEDAYGRGAAAINAAEGFIRQILGWREFVRGVYWLRMPGYAATNALEAQRPLPGFYWTGETEMNCLAHAIGDTRRHAYAHHIQRLMVTGNFALLAGIAPAAIEAWYLAVYADAFEWVELPNTHGMAIFADGGVLASKPYAASGKYIDRMSDYCASCTYDVATSSGPGACPFNHLYWDFLMRNASRLERNPRLAMAYRTLARFTPERRRQLRSDAARFLEALS
jgi:deoxyribodipyrimidine photolyase-related protein